jgi:HYDIN/CFA65/VesB family protein/centrosomal CEP192-like protein
MKSLPRMALALFVSAWAFSHASAQQLQCNPCSNDYGQVQIGTSKQYIFQLTNTGSKALTISSKRKNSKDFTFTQFPLPITLQPGGGTQMRVNFKPLVAGNLAATISLISNALNPKLVVNVSGTGVAANGATLGVSPSSLSFGNVTLGSSASLQLTLSASGGAVTVSSAQVNSSEFTLPGLVLPKTIAAGQNLAVTVLFTPNASGTASANLVLTSNAGNSPNTVPLTGVGVAPKAHSADLSWQASTDPVIGYNVYRGGKTGGPYTKINGTLNAPTNYTDSTVTAGATYYYVVTAVDANSVESAYSNEAKVVIPSP